MTRSGFLSYIAVCLSLCAATSQAQQITATPGDEKWGDRKTVISQGQILWYDATGVWLFNGSTSVRLQATITVNDPTFTLGNDSTPGRVIAAWRTGADGDTYVNADGGTTIKVFPTNPINAAVTMNLESVAVADGCVFMALNAPNANAQQVSFVYKVNATTGAAVLIGGAATAAPGRVNKLATSQCKAVWLYDDSTNPMRLYYYDGRATSADGSYVTTIETDATLTGPEITNGKIVYSKQVGGIGQVFVYDTTAVSPAPVQLTNYALTSRSVGTNSGGIFTDGRHLAWTWQTTAGNSRQIVLNGQVPMTDSTNKPADGATTFYPFQLDRGQLSWVGTGTLRFADSNGITAVPLTPSTTFNKAFLADGYLTWLGTATGQTNLDVFRYAAAAPVATSPPLVIIASAAPGQVTVAWERILGASAHNLYMAQVSGVTKDNYASLTGGQRFTNVTSPYTIPALANGSYFFVVTAVEGGIEGPSSRQASAVVGTAWSRAYDTQHYSFFDVKADRANASILYAASSEGVWNSIDSARTWSPMPGLLNGVDIQAVGANGSTVIALSKDERIFRSTTSGASWLQVAVSTPTRLVGSTHKSLMNDPLNASIWYAGDFNTTNSTPKSFVLKSIDGGATWTQAGTFSGGSDIRAYGLAADAATANVVYASGSGVPVAKTVDGAATWSDISPRFGRFYGLAVGPANTVYTCGVDVSSSPVGVYKSTNGGTSWTQMNSGLPTLLPNLSSLFLDPTNPNIVFAGGADGYFFSTNGATTWAAGPGGTYPSASLQITAMTMTASRTLVAATNAGIFILPQGAGPTLAQVSPSSGTASGGTVVTLTGTNFVAASGLRVLLGGSDAVVNLGGSTSTSIQVTAPAHAAGAVDVVAINPDGQSAVLPASFTFIGCTFEVSPLSAAFSSGAASGSIQVSAGTGCPWTASVPGGFVSITAGSSGTGNGTVTYQVQQNTTSAGRSITVTVAGRSVVVNQAASGVTPPLLAATASSSTQVSLAWTSVPGATYTVMRSQSGLSFAPVVTTSSLAFNDTVSTGAYLYRVDAMASSTLLASSNIDLAVPFAYFNPSLAGGTIVRAAHFTDLRQVVNSARALFGWSAASYTNSIVVGGLVKVVDITEIRGAVDRVRAAIALAPMSYSDPTVTPAVTVIKATHIQELRSALQ